MRKVLWSAAVAVCLVSALLFGRVLAGEGEEASPAKPKPVLMTPTQANEALKTKNPKYKGDGRYLVDEKGNVVAAELTGTAVTDLSPLKGVPFKVLDLRGTKIKNLSPLKGMPLTNLYLEGTPVEDIAPLKGMKLVELYLSNAKVKDLAPLAGMPLRQLNLLGAPIDKVEALRGLPLEMLWLNETGVEDIEPLAGCPLMSLTLHKTPVRDISPLAECGTLRRLHIGETEVTDLTAITGLPLTRLIFTPSKIAIGLRKVREMKTITEIGATFETRMPPEIFWSLYDEGAFAGK
jgi:hypothetical protein